MLISCWNSTSLLLVNGYLNEFISQLLTCLKHRKNIMYKSQSSFIYPHLLISTKFISSTDSSWLQELSLSVGDTTLLQLSLEDVIKGLPSTALFAAVICTVTRCITWHRYQQMQSKLWINLWYLLYKFSNVIGVDICNGAI